MCLGEDNFPLSKGHLISRAGIFIYYGDGEGGKSERRGKVKRLKKLTRRKVVTVVPDLDAEGGEKEATFLKVTLVYYINI